MDKNQGKPCETCINEEKTGGMYPCVSCRSGDKWVAKKAQEDDTPMVSISEEKPLFVFGEGVGAERTASQILEDLSFKEATEGAFIYQRSPFVVTLADMLADRLGRGIEPPKRPASLLALADEIADSLLSWRDGSGGSKDLRKAQRILTVLVMLEEEDVED